MATAGKRLTRKEIRQPDWFQRFMEGALETYRKSRNQTLLAIAAAVAIVFVIWGWQVFRDRQDLLASQEFGQAMTLYHTGKYKEALAVLKKVQALRWSRFANFAHLYEANSFLAQDDLTNAVQAAQRFVAGTKDNSLLRQIGLLSLGNIEERRDRCKDAIRHYADAEKIPEAFREVAFLGKARCLEQSGDIKGAIAAYREVLKNQPSAPLALKIAELESKLAEEATGK